MVGLRVGESQERLQIITVIEETFHEERVAEHLSIISPGFRMENRRKLSDVKGIRGALYRWRQARARSALAARGVTNFLRLRLNGSGSHPPIAAVVVGRNDDYMSDFAERLHATVEWNVRYLVNEVVFVEWNPPDDRNLLSYELSRRFKCLRAYVVPPATHQRLCRNENIKLLEYHAKNVGVRRAQASWIMTTNADAAVGFDSVRNILGAELDPEIVWTAERFDIPWVENQQKAIGLIDSLRFRRPIPYHMLGTGEFCLASKELWHRVRGYDEGMVRHRIGCDRRGTAQMLAHGATIKRVGTVLHLTHPTSCTESVQPHHGELATVEGVPYQNDDDWGLGNLHEVELADRVWRLE